ncbi:MAG: hypothetical protein AAFO81_08005 [Pseudomonadota bacterium]
MIDSIQRSLSRLLATSCLALLSIGMTSAQRADGQQGDEQPRYQVNYRIDLTGAQRMYVTLTITQSNGALKHMTLVDLGTQTPVNATAGDVRRNGNDVTWEVAPTGGALRWDQPVRRTRANGSVDALRTEDWAVLRAEDAIPPIATMTVAGADAETTLEFVLPDGWSIATPYTRDDNGSFAVEDNGRRFDKPDGWLVAGDIGVRRETIAATQVAIAAPRNAGARRLDTLAFLHWHLPYVRELFPAFPDRLLIAMANDPFFRGGLSAPNSLFMHADRPLISGNGTSSLLHELVHVGFSRTAVNGEDWIVEGIAEFYSYTLLHRAGSVSDARSDSTQRSLSEWAKRARRLPAKASTGSRTAMAAGVFVELADEIKRRTRDKKSIDDVIVRMANKPEKVSLTELRQAARAVIGKPSETLADDNLPGYPIVAKEPSTDGR